MDINEIHLTKIYEEVPGRVGIFTEKFVDVRTLPDEDWLLRSRWGKDGFELCYVFCIDREEQCPRFSWTWKDDDCNTGTTYRVDCLVYGSDFHPPHKLEMLKCLRGEVTWNYLIAAPTTRDEAMDYCERDAQETKAMSQYIGPIEWSRVKPHNAGFDKTWNGVVMGKTKFSISLQKMTNFYALYSQKSKTTSAIIDVFDELIVALHNADILLKKSAKKRVR